MFLVLQVKFFRLIQANDDMKFYIQFYIHDWYNVPRKCFTFDKSICTSLGCVSIYNCLFTILFSIAYRLHCHYEIELQHSIYNKSPVRIVRNSNPRQGNTGLVPLVNLKKLLSAIYFADLPETQKDKTSIPWTPGS